VSNRQSLSQLTQTHTHTLRMHVHTHYERTHTLRTHAHACTHYARTHTTHAPHTWYWYITSTHICTHTMTSDINREGKIVITTYDTTVYRNPCADDDMVQSEYSLTPCNHEEFDTRVTLHAANAAASQGYKRILIIANDTDVVILAVSFFNEIGAEKLWVTFGKGKNSTFPFMMFAMPCLLKKHMLYLVFMP